MAQPVLTGVDTWLSFKWKQELRTFRSERSEWRRDDLEYREVEISMAEKMRRSRTLRKMWREEDTEQRHLENSRYLWSRLKETNRREAEEKASHMRSLSWLTALVAGFTMTAPVEFSYRSPNPPQWMVNCFAFSTAIVPGLMTVSAILCIHLLEQIVKTAKTFVSESAEEDFFLSCWRFAHKETGLEAPPAPQETFSQSWDTTSERDWQWIFRFFSLGISIFFFLLGFMGLLKFDPVHWLGLGFCSVLAISFIVWLSIRLWWGSYITTNQKSRRGISATKIERNLDPFDWHIKPEVFSYDSTSDEEC